MKPAALYEGSYSVDTSKKFIPFDPAIHQAKDRPASLFISVQPFLLKTGDELVLFDTGLGFTDDAGELILHQNIRKNGFEPEEVTRVLLSHLHLDHSGGIGFKSKDGDYALSFPDAEYVVQRGEWEAAYSNTSRSYPLEVFDVLQRSGNLHLVEGNGKLNEAISYELSGGHSQFHQVFLVQSDKGPVFFGGDELPEPEQLLRRFKAKYDFDGEKAMELREEYGKRAAEGGWTCLFYHAKKNAIGGVTYGDEVFKIVPAG